MTPAEQHAAGLPVLEHGQAAMLEREESAAADLERGLATLMDAMTTVAAAYIERAEASQREREACAEAIEAMNKLASVLGLPDEHHLPPSRVSVDGPAGAVQRAIPCGTAAVVFELASVIAERAAKEM